MSLSPSPSHLILLDSPPLSPTTLALTDVGCSPPSSPLGGICDLTPVKRRRQKGSQAHKKRQRQKSATNDYSQDAEDEPFELPDWGEDGGPHSPLTSSDARTNIDSVDEDFERYVDLVQADCLGFYQISRTVYVVQGWDKQKEGTVSGESPTFVYGCELIQVTVKLVPLTA